MIGFNDGIVNVVVIDPHQADDMKVAEPWSDMTFLARHAISLTLTKEQRAKERTARDAMKEVILADLDEHHPQVYGFVKKCLGEKNCQALNLKIAKDFAKIPPGMWEFGRKCKQIATAAEMLDFMQTQHVLDFMQTQVQFEDMFVRDFLKDWQAKYGEDKIPTAQQLLTYCKNNGGTLTWCQCQRRIKQARGQVESERAFRGSRRLMFRLRPRH